MTAFNSTVTAKESNNSKLIEILIDHNWQKEQQQKQTQQIYKSNNSLSVLHTHVYLQHVAVVRCLYDINRYFPLHIKFPFCICKITNDCSSHWMPCKLHTLPANLVVCATFRISLHFSVYFVCVCAFGCLCVCS